MLIGINFCYLIVLILIFVIIMGLSYIEYFLSALLMLEFICLLIFLFLFEGVRAINYFFGLYYLIFSVCEGALGLSLLVIISMMVGGDYFVVINLSH